MFEAIGLNLIASGLASGGGIGVEKVRDVLRHKRFSEDVDEFATEFTTALREIVVPALNKHTQETTTDIDVNWSAVAEEFNERPINFENEREAIVHITDAIGAGLPINLATNSSLRDIVEAAVADAYQTTIRTFAERVAGSELADVFVVETTVELTTAIDKLDGRMTSIQRELRRREAATLRNAGFVRLDPLYFERHELGEAELAWRTGFDFVEIEAGYPLPRERSISTDDDRQSVTDEVLNRLTTGENLVVIGEGGSGKSTVCKQVACQWHADRGSVLYRKSATAVSFDEPGTLIEFAHAAGDEILVVVEDATNESVSAIFEVLEEFKQTTDVAILLDARTSEWRTAEVVGKPCLERQRQQLGVIEIPAFDERECQRAANHYKKLTDDEMRITGEKLYEEVHDAEIGGPLVLAYRLTGPSTDSDQPLSALHSDVNRAYSEVDAWANGETLPQTVAAMINVLNAAELPVDSAFVHALAENQADHRTIERTIGFLEGTMLEQAASGIRTPHQMWSVLYLERILKSAGERIACDRFEQCVNAIFRLVDDEQARNQVRHWLRSDPDAFAPIEQASNEAAGQFVRRVADIGTTRPSLGIIYGTPETWRVPLPEICPVTAEIRWFTTRGKIHLDRGAFDSAQAEFDQLEQLIESTSDDKIAESERRLARVLGNRGLIAQKRGDRMTAKSYHEKALALQREIGDRHEEARSLTNLGLVAYQRGNPEIAEEHFEEALELRREVGDRHGEAQSLDNLGLVASKRGNFETAKSYHEKALELQREIGDDHDEVPNLGNLGLVIFERGDLETAKAYYEEVFAIRGEVGNRHEEARSLGNLGLIASKRGNFEAAKSYHEKALALQREVSDQHGEAWSLGNLGLVASECGNLETAESYHKKALVIRREVGDRHDVARSLGNLGLVSSKRGDLEIAKSYHKKALELQREMGDRFGEARSLTNLGLVATECGNLESAKLYHEKALAVRREVGDRHRKAHTLCDLGRIAKQCDSYQIAKEYFEEARAIFSDDDFILCTFIGFEEIIDICEQRGEISEAIKWCERAIELIDQFENERALTQAIELADQSWNDTTPERFQKRRSELVD